MNHGRTASVALLLAGIVAASVGAQQRPERMVVSSDPELAEIAEALLPELADRSGLALKEPVRLERRSRVQLVEYLRAKLDEELPPEQARATVDAYALLGLVPPDLDLRSVLLGLYTEQVAGFYEPDSTALFVMDDQPREDLEALLVHELVHAIQDQSADLSALTAPDVSSDRATAAQAAIEGHATLVMMEFMAEQMMGVRLDLAMLPDFAEQLQPALDAMRSQFPELASAPRVVQESLLFPYLEGAGFVQSLWTGGERLAPFGPYMPLSTEQIMDRSLADPPVELSLDVVGVPVVDDDVLGRLALGVFLDEHGGTGGEGVADAWEGDHYVLVDTGEGTRGMVWYILWEDASSRDRFVDLVSGALADFGVAASVEPVSLEGGPGTVLRVGDVADVSVEVGISETS
ncbi:MAG: hypothetical protein PVJ80_17315 [Gemmatimonadota bacterium]|jgi:hypothetical protein